MERRVKGIVGVFLKADNPEETREWYFKHLGIKSGQWVVLFDGELIK